MAGVLGVLGSLASNPVVQGVALMVLGWLLKVGKDAAVVVLRARGKHDVEVAQAGVAAAAQTPDANDDAVAAERLARARAEQAVLDALASAIKDQDPQALVNALANGKHSIPPSVLKAITKDGAP